MSAASRHGHRRARIRGRHAVWPIGVLCGMLILFGAVRLESPRADTVPLWQQTSYRKPGFDRSFKCDLIEEQSFAPQVAIFGGSRTMRMPPNEIVRAKKLRAFNYGLHNGRPTDAWAFINFLLERDPDVPPMQVWCVQVNSFGAGGIHQALILDERLSRHFPAGLIEPLRPWAKKQGVHNLLSGRRFDRRGLLLWNSYDRRVASGVPLRRVLDNYLNARMLATAGNRKVPRNTRQMKYFEKSLALANQRGVKPLIVIMPYHPRVLKVFRAHGWGVKERWLARYLNGLKSRYRITVLNCLPIKRWGGSANGFYDGSHINAANSKRLMRYCLKKAPGCFRLHPEWFPEPTPTPTPSPSPTGPETSPDPSEASPDAPGPSPQPPSTPDE